MGKDLISKQGNSTEPGDRLGRIVIGDEVWERRFSAWEREL